MKIDLKKVLFNEDGEDFTIGETKEKVTFGYIFTKALLTELKGDEEKVEDKGKRFTLWYEKLKDKKEAELTIEESVMIKERVGKAFGAIIYGQISLVLK